MVIAFLIGVGLCLGSFVNAFVWRLHRQAAAKNNTKDNRYSIVHGRSMCPHCEHELGAKDLIPVISWLSLRGKCRYCKKPIPDTPLPEIVMPILLVWSYIAWPYATQSWQAIDIVAFVIWAVLLTGFVTLALYDFRWQLLPDKLVAPLTVITAVFVSVVSIAEKDAGIVLGSLLGAGVIFGLFYGLYALSGGKWIGGGDVKMGVLLGLLAGGVVEAFMLLFIASLLGTVYIVSVTKGKGISRKTRLPFGPFLLLAAVIVVLYGTGLFDWYTDILLPA